MSKSVFIVSEWLAKPGHEQELWQRLKKLMSQTQQEKGCISARATRQIAHPGSPGKSKYTIVLMQEYADITDFDLHCQADYVTDFVKTYIENPKTAIIADGRCRCLSEAE